MPDTNESLKPISDLSAALLRFSAFEVLRSTDRSRLYSLQTGFYRDAVCIATDISQTNGNPVYFAWGTIWSALMMNINSKHPDVESTILAARSRLTIIFMLTEYDSSVKTSSNSIIDSVRRDFEIFRELILLPPLAFRRMLAVRC